MATRSNFMLLFQSMLLTTTTLLQNNPKPLVPISLFFILGLITCCVWLCLNCRTRAIDDAAFAKLRETDPTRVKTFMTKIDDNWVLRRFSVTFLMTYPFPVLIGFTWAVLLYYTYIGQ